jgi:hypothetical protein
MIVVSALLFVAALFIGWDGYKAYMRHGATPAAPVPRPATVPPGAHQPPAAHA